MIGFADEPIALPDPVPLGGYALRTGPSDGGHDPLLATAVVSGDVALVSLDLLAITDGLNREIVAALPDLRLLVTATHTHAGPGGDHRDLLRADPYYPAPVRRAVVVAVTTAVRRAQRIARHARLDVRRGFIDGIATNRVFGSVVADSPAALVIACDEADEPLGAIVNYACHPTVLDASNRRLSADYVGAVRRRLAECVGPMPILFLNGACGDLSTRGSREASTFAEVDRLGRIVADELLNLPASTYPISDVAAATATVTIRQRGPITAPPSCDGAIGYILSVDPEIAATQANRLVDLDVHAMRLGELSVVGLPVELFSAWHPQWSDPVLLACYAGGHHGYAVTPETPPGAYERLSSWLPDDAGGLLVAAAEKLRQELM